jgi:S-adenosylmethionine hydrolase
MARLNRPIVLLTDFGFRDSYVGQVKAVIAGINPMAHVIDLSHAITPFAIDEGAWTLETALSVLPKDAVVCAVVDPGVGTSRRPLVVPAEGRHFVGPDNGLLSAAFPAAMRADAPPAGGAMTVPASVDARELCEPQFRRDSVSATFHGRDIFAPMAAWLSLGVAHAIVGPPVPEAVALPPFCGRPRAFGELEGSVIHIDRYGNLVTTIRAAELFPCFALEVGGAVIDTHVRTFATAPRGVPFCHADSSGFVAIALNQGSAAEALGVRRGDPVLVRCR